MLDALEAMMGNRDTAVNVKSKTVWNIKGFHTVMNVPNIPARGYGIWKKVTVHDMG